MRRDGLASSRLSGMARQGRWRTRCQTVPTSTVHSPGWQGSAYAGTPSRSCARRAAHNRNPRERAAKARADPLTAYLNWTLAAGCVPRGRGSRVNVRALVVSTPGQTVGDVLGRLKCQRCGKMPGVAWLGCGSNRSCCWGEQATDGQDVGGAWGSSTPASSDKSGPA